MERGTPDTGAVAAGATETGIAETGIAETDAALRALADPLRARIVELLAVEQLCTCHLVELTGARQTNISNHLRVLRAVGLVDAEPAGRYTYYRLRPEALRAVAGRFANLAERAAATTTLRRACP
jgi:ArsR family transcriptional regulator